MDSADRVVLVGASVATGAFVNGAREGGYDGDIVVIDEDLDAPYDRPPLSKDFLGGTDRRPPAPWWDERCVLVRGRAVDLDTAERRVRVECATGDLDIAGDHVVIATGASPIRLPSATDGVIHLRSARDARALRAMIRPKTRVAILGAGTIGTELASSLSALGCEAFIIDQASRPLDRFFAGHLGEQAASWISDAGVDLWLSTEVASVARAEKGFEILSSTGESFCSDVVVSAVGVRPATQWLEGTCLELASGVRCDADGRALDSRGEVVSGIYAVGDVANWARSDGTFKRREDWTTAQRRGRHVSQMLFGREPLPISREPDYFWTHQFNRRVQVLGEPSRTAALVTQSTTPERNAAFYSMEEDGGPVCWVAINAPREFAMAMRDAMQAVG